VFREAKAPVQVRIRERAKAKEEKATDKGGSLWE
jgi:hypothetical protein